jgi:hypothetical protein
VSLRKPLLRCLVIALVMLDIGPVFSYALSLDEMAATISPRTEFIVDVNPRTISIPNNQCGNVTVMVAPPYGSGNVTVNLTVASIPKSVNTQFYPTSPIMIPPGAPLFSVLRICVGSNASPGNYTLTVLATASSTSGPVAHETEVLLTISSPYAEYWISATPSSLVIPQGSSGKSEITVPILPLSDVIVGPSLSWFVHTTVRTEALPKISISMRASPIPPSYELANSTLIVMVDKNVAAGNYTIGITATWPYRNESRQILIPLTVVSPMSAEVVLLVIAVGAIALAVTVAVIYLAFANWKTHGVKGQRGTMF